MANKLSKFFRVALEGATTDGRTIAREWITQMAKNFDPSKYGARVWLEHIRGILPDSPFKAYGDVVALKAEEVDIDGTKKMALFAQLAPTPELIQFTKARQKIYTSIEINQKFADSGEAYLVGLGITDSPASLGTEMLTFAAQHPDANPLQARKSSPDTLFSAATESTIEFVDADPETKSLTAMVKGLVDKFKTKKTDDESKFTDMTEAVGLLLTHVEQRDEQFTAQKARIDAMEKTIESSTTNFNALKAQLEQEESKQPHRPAATGGKGEQQTDC